METVATKVCVKCGLNKPRADYYSRGDGTVRVQAKCKQCCLLYNAEIAREYRKNNPEKMQNFELKRSHNITLDDYTVLLKEQGGVCAICKKPPGSTGTGNKGKGTLAVDHDHLTGTYRGLLCTNCNLGVGSFFDDPVLLENAAAYLKEYRALVISILAQKSKVEIIQTELVVSMLDEIEKL